METDVVIIGGGIIGISCAYALAKTGSKVHVLEAVDLQAGSSFGNAGLICPGFSKPVPAPGVLMRGVRWMLNPASPFYMRPRLELDFLTWLWHFQKSCNKKALHRAIPVLHKMQCASHTIYEDWLTSTGIEAAYQQNGGLELFLTEKAYTKAPQEVAHMRSYGIDMSLLSREEVLAIEPAVSPNIVGGIHYKEDAHLDPGLFLERLAEKAIAAGVNISTDSEVTGFSVFNGEIKTARTNSAEIRGRQFIICAGAWTTKIVAALGIKLLMQPGKGYSITMARPERSPRIPLHLSEASMAVTPIGHSLRFAGTMELTGIDTSINERRIAAIRAGGFRYLAEIENTEGYKVWGGMRPLPADGMPFIGRADTHRNLVIATGHGMLGMSMGPITGQLVAEIIGGKKPTIDLSPFRINRF